MKKRKFGLALSLVLAAGTILGACGSSEETNSKDNSGGTKEESKFTVAMVTDTGGVDDKSFNQSAWEGLQAFGEENGLEKGQDGYDYLYSKSDADYATNLNSLVRNEFDLIFGIGYKFAADIKEVENNARIPNLRLLMKLLKETTLQVLHFMKNMVLF